MSDFRCFQCKYSDDPEWVKACAKTLQHQGQELEFYVEAMKAPFRRFIIRLLDRWVH